MARSSLFGRRIYIAGSIPDDLSVAPVAEVEQARELAQGLVRELLDRILIRWTHIRHCENS